MPGGIRPLTKALNVCRPFVRAHSGKFHFALGRPRRRSTEHHRLGVPLPSFVAMILAPGHRRSTTDENKGIRRDWDGLETQQSTQ
ncbi:uncharacterized protein BJX67DRAFT_302519 [Aspergillus lucknowensis]|uniref:Uncharacterized protein n=1 Tax=Aspergillus lucknowensis TaxID=176173 RepID=A0ABR4LZN1_9EURO